MSTQVFRLDKREQYTKAGPDDLIRLQPVPGANGRPLFLPKCVLEKTAYAIVHCEALHLSGPTGTAKTSLMEALQVPENFGAIVSAMGFPFKPLKVYPIEMATFDAPGELYHRRSLRNGTTYDEASPIVIALKDAEMANGSCYPVIWLREIGRVHSAAVQGGLLDLMPQAGDVTLPDGSRVGGNVCFAADSNYQAESDSTHTLVTFDDALRRRFTVNVTLDYLPPEQEVQVLSHLFKDQRRQRIDDDLIARVVRLGQRIRAQRHEGNLLTLPPPTIAGHVAFLQMAERVPHLSLQQIALSTALGNASLEDRKVALAVFNEVFGLQQDVDEEDLTKGRGLF
jgi:MoxR-like ATPase